MRRSAFGVVVSVVAMLMLLCPSGQSALLSYWPLEDGTGSTTAANVVAGGPVADLRNMDPNTVWVPGRFGTGLEFDGGNDYLNAVLNVSETSGTSSFWFRTTDPNRGMFAIVDGELGGGGYDRLVWLGGGNVGARIWSDETIASAGRALADGQWHHVAHVHGPDAFGYGIGGQRLFIDGQEVANGNKASSDFNWQQRVNVGWAADAAIDFFQGTMDDVALWDTALGPAEIRQLAAGTAPTMIVEPVPSAPVPPPPTTPYEQAVMADGPIGYWRLGESNSDDLAVDMTGSHHGSYRFAPSMGVPGAIHGDPDTAVQMDGINDHVVVPDAPDLQITGDMTMEFWYNKVAETADWVRIVGKGNTVHRNYGVWDEAGGNGRVLVQQYNNNSAVVSALTPNHNVAGKWIHTVATIQGNEVRVYNDGILDLVTTRSGPPSTSADPLTFGWAGFHTFLNGYLDEVALYDHALNPTQVAEHFRVGRGIMPGWLPGGWTSQDVGSPAIAGNAGYVPDDDAFVVLGGGTDIWGNADQFHFLSQDWSGDFNAIARVDGVHRVDAYTRVGVMAREDAAAAGSRNVMAALETDRGTHMQWRDGTNGGSDWTTSFPGSPNAQSGPVWLMLTRRGSTFRMYYAPDVNGEPGWWSDAALHLNGMASDIALGFAVTAHRGDARTEATFDNTSFFTPGAPVAELGNFPWPRQYNLGGKAYAEAPGGGVVGPVLWKLERVTDPILIAPGGEPGFQAEWFSNTTFSGTPDFIDIVHAIDRDNYDYPGTDWTGDINNFTVRYTSMLYVPADGTYVFGEHVDDEAWLDIDGSQVLWNNQWNVPTQAAVALTEGWHDMEFRTREGGGGDYAYLTWDRGLGGSLEPLAAFDVMELMAQGYYNVGDPSLFGDFGFFLPTPEMWNVLLTVDYGGDQAYAFRTFLGAPEPTTGMLLAAGLLALSRRRRR